jgi:hypothetical protein
LDCSFSQSILGSIRIDHAGAIFYLGSQSCQDESSEKAKEEGILVLARREYEILFQEVNKMEIGQLGKQNIHEESSRLINDCTKLFYSLDSHLTFQ